MLGDSTRQVRRRQLGALIRRARKQARRSLIQCANLLNTTVQNIIDIESGQTDISAAQLETLAEFFGVPATYFWEERPPADEEDEPDLPDIVQERRSLRQKLIGVQLRLARQKAEKTQKDCAEFLGVSPRLISEYEYGRRDIPLVELEALAEYLDAPLEMFLDFEARCQESGPENEAGVAIAGAQVTPPAAVADELQHLTPQLREFIAMPVNSLYLHLAHKLSQLPASVLREIGESLLEITY